MVGHIAEVGQIVAVDFRRGNAPPAKDNLGFITQCRQAALLPPCVLMQMATRKASSDFVMLRALTRPYGLTAVLQCEIRYKRLTNQTGTRCWIRTVSPFRGGRPVGRVFALASGFYPGDSTDGSPRAVGTF